VEDRDHDASAKDEHQENGNHGYYHPSDEFCGKQSQLDELEEAEEVARQQPVKDAEVVEEITEVAQETPAENLEEIPPLVKIATKQDAEEEKDG
jgi:hypothetical protein